MAAYKKQDDYAARQQRRKPQKAHSADDPKSARSPDGRRRSGTLHQMLFTKQRACAQKADASHHAAYHLGRINREMRIGRTIAEFEYSDRQCARRKGDDDERPEIDRLAMQETLQADRQGKQDGAAQPGQGIQPGKMDGRESPCFHHRETRSWLLGSSPLIAASFSARCASGGLIAALVSATTAPRFPIGSSGPVVVSRAVCRSASALTRPPSKIASAETSSHNSNTTTAPRDPYVAL